MKPQDQSVDLKRKKAESDALFLSIGEGAIFTDGQARISRVNQVALDILGYQAEDLVGKWYPDAIIAEDADEHRIPNLERPITQAFLTGKSTSARVLYYRKDGSKIVVYLTVSPVMLDGKPIGAIEVFRDITREVELEHAKDEFISLASHQLRTPATGVKQYTGMLLEGYVGKLSEQQLAMVKSAYECNERQLTIINDLLRVAQIDAGKVKLNTQKTDIATITQRIIDDHRLKFESRAQTVVYRPPLMSIDATIDPERMRMVIENIVDNASKYTPNGKNIQVSVGSRKDHAFVKIRDEGVGIEEKDIDQVFQKFMRLPNPLSDAVGGSGLGLYWAKKIVDLHGGEIHVKSKLDQGTTFTIQVPI